MKTLKMKCSSCSKIWDVYSDNNQLTEKSISFGIGIPVKRSRTKYDLSVTLGERGTTENNLLKEQFVKFGLSVSYDGIWFVKRKYD